MFPLFSGLMYRPVARKVALDSLTPPLFFPFHVCFVVYRLVGLAKTLELLPVDYACLSVALHCGGSVIAAYAAFSFELYDTAFFFPWRW